MDIDYSFTAPGTNFRPPVVPVNRNISKLTTLVWKMENAFSSPLRPLESAHTHTRSQQDTGLRDGKKTTKKFLCKKNASVLEPLRFFSPPRNRTGVTHSEICTSACVRAYCVSPVPREKLLSAGGIQITIELFIVTDCKIKTVTTNQNNTQHNPWALNNGKTIKMSIWTTPVQFSLKTHSCGTNEEQTMAAVPRVRTPRPSTSKVYEQKNRERERERAS